MNKNPMTLKINFRKKKQAKGNNAYIYCRLRLHGSDATDFSTYVKSTDYWNSENQMFLGKDAGSISGNDKLSEIADDIRLLYKEMKRSSEPTVHDLRNKYVKQAEKKTLLDIYSDHWKTVVKREGQPGYTAGTKKAHKSLHTIIKKFLIRQHRTDIDLLDIRASFGKDFVSFLRDDRKYAQNYIVRNLNHLKRMIDLSISEGYLTSNPLSNQVELLKPPGSILYLTEKEIELLKDNSLLTDSQKRVADAFLFQCFTGLCYCDLKRFSAKDHIVNIQGRDVIQYSRNKTETPFTIPLLSYPKLLIERYQGNIPIVSNQKMNDYIKIVAKTVGINKYLTTHIGRKTAGTYLLNNDVPMITVSKILGHKSVRTTEKIYAYLMEETILRHTLHLT
jgi:integrase/recombinase XerD